MMDSSSWLETLHTKQTIQNNNKLSIMLKTAVQMLMPTSISRRSSYFSASVQNISWGNDNLLENRERDETFQSLEYLTADNLIVEIVHTFWKGGRDEVTTVTQHSMIAWWQN